MTVLKVVVCTKCEDVNKPVKRYRVATEDRTATIELCEEDAKAIEALVALVPMRGRRRAANRVATMEEVKAQRMPKAAKKAPAKRGPGIKR